MLSRLLQLLIANRKVCPQSTRVSKIDTAQILDCHCKLRQSEIGHFSVRGEGDVQKSEAKVGAASGGFQAVGRAEDETGPCSGFGQILFHVCSWSVPGAERCNLLYLQPCSHCSQCSMSQKNIVSLRRFIAILEPCRHWEHLETEAERLGTNWEQDWEHFKRRPFGNATRDGSTTALGTAASLGHVGTARPGSCRFESTGLAVWQGISRAPR
jgi:hypothetical protein